MTITLCNKYILCTCKWGIFYFKNNVFLLQHLYLGTFLLESHNIGANIDIICWFSLIFFSRPPTPKKKYNRLPPYSSKLSAMWGKRTFLFWSTLRGTRTRKQTFVLRWEAYYWCENVAKLTDSLYCRRPYYRGVIITQIFNSVSVRGYGIPRNFQLLTCKNENCISIVCIQSLIESIQLWVS